MTEILGTIYHVSDECLILLVDNSCLSKLSLHVLNAGIYIIPKFSLKN